jgi:hypothetical protein
VGQHVNLPKQDSRANLWDREQHSKVNCPNLLGEELTKLSCSCHLVKTADLSTLQELTVLPYLTSQFQLILWTEGTK